jgi:hypothetical protein
MKGVSTNTHDQTCHTPLQIEKNEREIRSTDMTPAEHFRARMNLPMASSSFGIPATEEILKDIERCSKMIDERILNGTYYALPSEKY